MNLNMRAAAMLVWLPDGENPAFESFVPESVQPPPSLNPEAWWCLEDAIVYAHAGQFSGSLYRTAIYE
jgi:hypothetical protein